MNTLNKLFNVSTALTVSSVFGVAAYKALCYVDLTSLVHGNPAEVFGGSVVAMVVLAAVWASNR